jgi:hypothetical protein
MLCKEELYWSHFKIGLSKSVFGNGPWDYEPDRIWWLDDETGFYCLIYRSPELGNLFGYIAIPQGHPWWDKTIDELNTIDVHGGITYSEGNGHHSTMYYNKGHKFVGPFIESHSTVDGNIVLDINLWIIGFDTCHFGDEVPALKHIQAPLRYVKTYRDASFMEAELKSLCKQALAALG